MARIFHNVCRWLAERPALLMLLTLAAAAAVRLVLMSVRWINPDEGAHLLDGRLIFLLSPDLLREYRVVMLRPKLARMHGLDETEVDALLTDITANALWRDPPADAMHQAPDPQDGH